MTLLARLLRLYLLRFPIARGKGLVLRKLVVHLPVEQREFDAILPGGGRIRARWDEVVGRKLLREGAFEPMEVRTLTARVASGDVAVDVGANIGLFAIPLALAGARVIAVEPLAENVRRLRFNAEGNHLDNLVIVEAACGASDGRAVLHSAADPAFGSLKDVVKYRSASDLDVQVRSLDSLWHELGRPRIAIVKIDVEGGELDVIAGAGELLAANGPLLMVEADPGRAAEALCGQLASLGYAEVTPPSFSTVNHLFSKS